MNGRGLVMLVAVVLVGATAATGGALAVEDGDAGDPAAADEPAFPPSLVEFEADTVVMEVEIGEGGTARWRVEYRRRLDDENATAAFEAYRDRVESKPLTVTGPFRDDMASAADAAEAETGRRMTIGNVTVDARRRQVPETFGVVTFRFQWHGFAAVEDDRLRAGPALVDFFLTNRTTLLFSWSDRYERTEVSPSPDETSERSVTWNGPLEFAPGEPLVVVESTVESGLPLVPIGGSILVLACAALGATMIVRRSSTDEADAGVAATGAGDTAGATDPEPAAESGAAEDSRAVGDSPASTASTETGGADGAEAEPREASGDERARAGESDQVPSDLLSSEERVLRLLEQRGGRVKQQTVVETFGWSETKTSQVVNDLREAGRIEVYRIGRENVLALPGEMDV